MRAFKMPTKETPNPPVKRSTRRKRRAGLPKESSVVAVKTLISPQGTRFRILTTTEKDAYERDDPIQKLEVKP